MSDVPEPEKAQSAEAPGSVIQLPGGTFWAHETPEQIRERMGEARLGTDDHEDGMLHLVGLDLFPGEEGVVEPYELAIDPRFLVSYRGLTEKVWQAHLDEARRIHRQQGGADGATESPSIPGFKIVQGGDLGQVLAEALTSVEPPGGQRPQHNDGRGPGQPMLTARANDDARNEVCCCGHPAGQHDMSTEFVGHCDEADCHCTLFHQH